MIQIASLEQRQGLAWAAMGVGVALAIVGFASREVNILVRVFSVASALIVGIIVMGFFHDLSPYGGLASVGIGAYVAGLATVSLLIGVFLPETLREAKSIAVPSTWQVRTGLDAEAVRLCPHGHHNSATSKFCNTCGATLDDESLRHCSQGHPLSSRARYCARCGELVGTTLVEVQEERTTSSEVSDSFFDHSQGEEDVPDNIRAERVRMQDELLSAVKERGLRDTFDSEWVLGACDWIPTRAIQVVELAQLAQCDEYDAADALRKCGWNEDSAWDELDSTGAIDTHPWRY